MMSHARAFIQYLLNVMFSFWMSGASGMVLMVLSWSWTLHIQGADVVVVVVGEVVVGRRSRSGLVLVFKAMNRSKNVRSGMEKILTKSRNPLINTEYSSSLSDGNGIDGSSITGIQSSIHIYRSVTNNI